MDIDFSRSLVYMTEDDEWWKKILIGGLISLIPFVGQLYLMGYALQVLRNVIAGREIPLPEATEDLEGKLRDGLLSSVITIAYCLVPAIIIACAIAGAAIFGSDQGSNGAGAIATAWMICSCCIAILIGALSSLFLPFAWSAYAETGQFGDAFKLGEIWQTVKDNLGPTIVVVLASGLVAFVAAIAGLIACIIGLLFTWFYAQLVIAFLYGSLYRQAKARAS